MTLQFDNITGSGKVYLDVMKSICGDTSGKSMADLCCNHSPYTCQLGFSERVYVDILPRILDEQNEQQYFIQANVLEFLKDKQNKYDVTICSDGIEHLTKYDGVLLLHLMEQSSKKQVLFTPLGNYMVDNSDNPEGHHSGWFPNETPNYAMIIFPNYHPTLNVGAYFFWNCENIEQDFERVKNELKQKGYE